MRTAGFPSKGGSEREAGLRPREIDPPIWRLVETLTFPSTTGAAALSSLLSKETQSSPDSVIDAKRLRGAVVAAVDGLPRGERDVVVLHYYDGRPFFEIGESLDLSSRQVAFLHARALEFLEQALAPTVRSFLEDDLVPR